MDTNIVRTARPPRNRFDNRLVVVGLGAAAIGAGAALNWGWLVTIGVAPLIAGLLPCAVMCAVGFCATNRKGKGS